VDFIVADGDNSDIDLIQSTDTDIGGNDDITAGSGNDTIIAGEDGEIVDNDVWTSPTQITRTVDADSSDGDTVNAGDGNNLVFGDNGRITAAVENINRFVDATTTATADLNVTITLGLAETIESLTGGSDTITTGIGSDVIFGGIDADVIVANQVMTRMHLISTASSPLSRIMVVTM
jgi:Ca2+-binding RTX toxin-like protein